MATGGARGPDPLRLVSTAEDYPRVFSSGGGWRIGRCEEDRYWILQERIGGERPYWKTRLETTDVAELSQHTRWVTGNETLAGWLDELLAVLGRQGGSERG